MIFALLLASFPNPTTGNASGGNIPIYTYATLPPATGKTTLVRLTDHNRGLWASNGTSWSPLNGVEVWNPVDFGADPTGIADSSTAINLAITTMSAANNESVGFPLVFPPGIYRLSASIDVTRRIIMDCNSAALNQTPGCYLLPDVAVTAIVVHYGGSEGPDGGSGAASTIQNISIVGTQATTWAANTVKTLNSYVQPTGYSQYLMKATARTGDFKTGAVEPTWPATAFAISGGVAGGSTGATQSDNHVTWTLVHQTGIWCKATCNINNVTISNISGDGVEVVASTSDTPPTNANGSSIHGLFTQYTNGNSFYLDGADSNAGYFEQVNGNYYRGYCVWDSSFLGNTHIGDQCASTLTPLGSYYNDNPNSQSVYEGCYAESEGTNKATIMAPATFGGGLIGDGFDSSSTGYLMNGGVLTNWSVTSTLPATSTTFLGLGRPGSNIAWYSKGYDASLVLQSTLDFRYTTGGFSPGFWRFDLDGSDATVPLLFGTSNQAYVKPGVAVFPVGIDIGGPIVGGYPGVNFYAGTGVPVSGTYVVGDVILNSTPTAGTPIEWRCITAGTPGTWEAIYGYSGSPKTGITAHAGGGGVGSCTQLTAVTLSRVDTVATDHNSVCLPTCSAGLTMNVSNKGAHILDVYPPTGGHIWNAQGNNDLGANTPESMGICGVGLCFDTFTCTDGTQWIGLN